MALSAPTANFAKAKEDAKEEHVEQVHNLEEQLKEEKQKAIESTKEQTNIAAKLEDRIAGAESEQYDTRIEFETEQSTSSVHIMELAKAKEGAEDAKMSFSQRGTSRAEQVCSLEK